MRRSIDGLVTRITHNDSCLILCENISTGFPFPPREVINYLNIPILIDIRAKRSNFMRRLQMQMQLRLSVLVRDSGA